MIKMTNFWQGLDPRSKLFFFIFTVWMFVFLDTAYPLIIVGNLFFLFLFTKISNCNLKQLAKRFVSLLPMIFFTTCLLPFQSLTNHSDEIVFSFGLNINVYTSGLERFMLLFSKSVFILMTTIIFISTTSLKSVIQALHKLKVPDWILSILTFLIKLIQLFSDEMRRMYIAYSARKIHLSFFKKISTLAKMSAIYFLRVFERSERMHMAMLSRGFNGQSSTQATLKWQIADNYVVIVSTLIMVFVIIWN